jgi:hypothetical protein
MHNAGEDLPRISIPRTSVNKGKMKGRASSISAPIAEGLLLRYYYLTPRIRRPLARRGYIRSSSSACFSCGYCNDAYLLRV